MPANELLLPAEILHEIFTQVTALEQNGQRTFHACTLVSRSWYSSAVEFLYDSPDIEGKNFDSFVRAICPSVNAHIRTNGLAELVRRLDMSKLVHNGSKSLTARILGRVKGRLEEFVAPQASFAVNCLAALSKCSNLRRLNLSFVSEAIAMLDLIRSTSFLSKLESLHLPRSSDPLSMNSSPKFKWPVTLRELHISGGLRDSAAPYFRKLPPTLSYLSIRNCSNLTIEFIQPLIKTLGPQLHSLDILAPLPHVHHWPTPPLDLVLDLVPNLTHLKISVDLISIRFFEGPRPTSLTRLDLHCHDRSNCQYIEPLMVYNALGTDAFAKVRIVGVHYKLQWDTRLYLQDLMDLEELLIALAREDEAGAGISEAEAGVKRLTGP